MTTTDPVAIFGVAGFTIAILLAGLGIVWKRLVKCQDSRDADRVEMAQLLVRTTDALTAAHTMVKDSQDMLRALVAEGRRDR